MLLLWLLVAAHGIFSCGWALLAAAWGLVPWPGIQGPSHWELRVSATGPPGKYQPGSSFLIFYLYPSIAD